LLNGEPLFGAWSSGCQPANRQLLMNATHNPQAAADQARDAYRNVTAQLGLLGLNPAIPEGVRSLAEKTVSQTRQVYDRSSDALDAAVATFEQTFDAAGQNAAAFNRKIIDISRRNLDSVFDLATSLAGAKDLVDIVELQRAHWQKQFAALKSQAEEVCALATMVAAAAGEPLNEQVKRGVDELRKANERVAPRWK
jgi:phasin